MRVLMLGWEFPPYISGGLGTACLGMTKGLDEIGVDVAFVLPTAVPIAETSHVDFKTPASVKPRPRAVAAQPAGAATETLEHVEFHRVQAALQAYATPQSYEQAVRKLIEQQKAVQQSGGEHSPYTEEPAAEAQPAPSMPSGTFVVGGGAHYGDDLMSQVQRYADLAVEVARTEPFDVIHAHDWMTFPAAACVAAATGKPLVVHVHSTEFDRAGNNVNQQVYDIERMGMHRADRVVCVSHLTRNLVVSRYGVPTEKVVVIYNAVQADNNGPLDLTPIKQNEKIVLFLGRVTMQKGPEYFLQAAAKVVEKFQDVRFVMAGSGDMITRMIRLAADLKIGRYVTFTGFLRGGDVDRIFRMADLYVMPSVSEPFGIAPLEALSHNVPVIISKQSGVSEVLTHVLKVDFWDTDEMANKILGVLRHEPLRKTLRQHGAIELRKFSWTDSARKLNGVYEAVCAARK